MKPENFCKQWEQRNKERWVGLTCPVVHVTDDVDVGKLLKESKNPIMVCQLTIKDLNLALNQKEI